MCFFSDTEDSAQMKIFLYQKAREAEFANQQHEQERKSGRRMCTKLLKTYYCCVSIISGLSLIKQSKTLMEIKNETHEADGKRESS